MNIHRVKQIGLIFSAIAFLGGLEIAASAESPETSHVLKARQDFRSIAAPDELFLETSEERDGETASEFLALGVYCEVFKPHVLLSFLGLEKLRHNSSLVLQAQNSRAPPAI